MRIPLRLILRGRAQFAKRWYLEEEYWKDSYPFIFGLAARKNASVEIEWILQKCKFDEPLCLDLCCGTGRHAAELAKRGYRITAVDSSKYLISQGKKLTRGRDVRFVRKNLEVDFSFGNFDLVLNLNSSFGQFKSNLSNTRFLINMAGAVADGGYLVISCVTREIVARCFKQRQQYVIRNGYARCARKRSADSSVIRSVWEFKNQGRRSQYFLKYHLYDHFWFVGLLEKCGFSVIETFGGWEGSKYDASAREMILICKKACPRNDNLSCEISF